MRRSDTCNLLRASGGVRVLQTNRGSCDHESLKVLVSCLELFLFPLRCTSLAHWIQICLVLPLLLFAIVIRGHSTITRRRAESLIPIGYTQSVRSNVRYWIASLTCSDEISVLPSRSAMVRETFRIRS